MVPDEPPAPAERVELGRAFRRDSLWSAAARRRMAARGPPGGVGDEGRPTEEPEATAPGPAADLESGPDSAPEVRGEAGRGEAWREDELMMRFSMPIHDRMAERRLPVEEALDGGLGCH